MADRWRPDWLRALARRVIGDEVARLDADVSAARAITADTIEAYETMREEFSAHVLFVAEHSALHPRCLDIPVYTDRQAYQLMDRLRTFTGHEYYDMEVWRCSVCPPHPLFGKVQHARVKLPAPREDDTAGGTGDVAGDGGVPAHAAPDDEADRVQVAIGGGPNRHTREDDAP